jgi:hypothetical protein
MIVVVVVVVVAIVVRFIDMFMRHFSVLLRVASAICLVCAKHSKLFHMFIVIELRFLKCCLHSKFVFVTQFNHMRQGLLSLGQQLFDKGNLFVCLFVDNRY